MEKNKFSFQFQSQKNHNQVPKVINSNQNPLLWIKRPFLYGLSNDQSYYHHNATDEYYWADSNNLAHPWL